jgi:hypothetical protein
MLELVRQLILEVARALLVDELSGRVRERIRRVIDGGEDGSAHRAARKAHLKVRKKLMHRIHTEHDRSS